MEVIKIEITVWSADTGWQTLYKEMKNVSDFSFQDWSISANKTRLAIDFTEIEDMNKIVD